MKREQVLEALEEDFRHASIERQWCEDAPALAEGSEQARAAVVALYEERDRLQTMLDTNRCNRGHETLPLALWDCPACHDETKRRLASLIAGSKAMLPANLCLSNENVPDSERIPLLATMGELRAFAAVIADAEAPR
ncbi:MAG TPA: hypothetical protein VGK41_01325 [Solirubrobacterales bacterium]